MLGVPLLGPDDTDGSGSLRFTVEPVPSSAPTQGHITHTHERFWQAPSMSDPHRVTVTELEQVTRRILDQVRSEIGEVVDLSADHYWVIGTADRFDLTKVPEPMAGQISDDVASIRECLSAPEVVLWHDLQHLTGVLLRLAALAYPAVP